MNGLTQAASGVTESNNFCVAPFLQITTHPSGSFSPCPYLGGTTWAPQYQTISESWNSPEIESLRADFLSNVKSTICNRCWDEEAHGKKSLRLRLWDPVNQTSDYPLLQNPGVLQDINSGEYRRGPKLLSIKNGNVCNAKCRSCHPGDSSRWIADAAKLAQQTGKSIYRIDVKEVNWTDLQIEEILVLSNHLSRLELFGGEPIYNKKVINLINQIVDSGNSLHIDLYINTNGSSDIVNRIPLLHRFRSVEIGVSIDGIGAHFEYTRHGVDYEKLVSNIKQWQTYFLQHKTPVTITSITTVSILNIFYLPQIKQQVKQLLGNDPFWNLLVDPDWLNIKHMPQALKSQVIKVLKDDSAFDEFVNLLTQPAEPAAWQQFLQITQTLDEIRKENFDHVFPEFAKLIKQYGYTGADLEQVEFGKIIVYIGDQVHPLGWYLEDNARNRDRNAVKITAAIHDKLQPGIYYTSLADVGGTDNLKKVCDQADTIIYQEPSWWQDTPRKRHRIFRMIFRQLFKKVSPSKKTVEKILEEFKEKTV